MHKTYLVNCDCSISSLLELIIIKLFPLYILSLHLSSLTMDDHRLSVAGPGICFIDTSCSHHSNILLAGPQFGINRRAQILPGMSSRQTEIKAFQGSIMD